MQTKIRGINVSTGVEIDVLADEEGALLAAYAAAPYEAITRTGTSFIARSTTATASVNALPTTTAGFGLFNSEADGGKSLIIDAIFALQITAHAVLTQAGLIAVCGVTRVAALTDALVERKTNSYGTPGSVALCAAGGAILDAVTGVAIGWMPYGNSVNCSVVSVPGMQLWAPIDGRLIVAPGRQFGVNVMAGDTTGTWNCGVMWHEKQINLD
uniref:Uncharacterized protein n=1 Tax=viral metagenome TaxID=1070528 RepID=A0A6M3JYI2_9ZZZZ